MALMTTASTGLADSYAPFVFSKKLLEYAKQQLVMNEYGDDVTFQKNQGSKTIRWLRPAAGDRTKVQGLSEGVPLATYREIAYTKIETTLIEFGELAQFSDQMTWIEVYPTLRQSIETMGEDLAQHADFFVTNELAGGAANAGMGLPAGTGLATANEIYAQGITSFANLVAATNTAGALVLPDILRAMTILDIARAPKKNGEYVAIVPPQTAYDLMQDSKFINAGLYGSTTGLYKGEVGRWYGVRIIKSTQPFTETTTKGTYATGAGAIYSNFVLGSGGFGIPHMSGLDQHSPRMYINDQPDKYDNLNQLVTVGWKSFWASKVLNNTWVVNIRSKTTYA